MVDDPGLFETMQLVRDRAHGAGEVAVSEERRKKRGAGGVGR